MTYTRPEINMVGDAANVIQGGVKFAPGDIDAIDGMWDLHPAYDLDE